MFLSRKEVILAKLRFICEQAISATIFVAVLMLILALNKL